MLITHWLQYHGFYVQRLNSGRIPIDEGAKRRLIQLSEKGTPDLMAFRMIHEKILLTGKGAHSIDRTRTQLLFIEVKRPGKRATVIQSAKMQELEEYGALCFVATSIEDVAQQLAL